MEIIIRTSSERPIYEQIEHQIKLVIMNGELSEGAILPSIRKLAKNLHISVITVQRAYDNLQRDGFIETVKGRGTFVSKVNKEFIKEEELKKIETSLEQAVLSGKKNGIKLDQLIEILTMIYSEN